MKRLILCCDGTWNSADQESNQVPCPTNVVKISYRIAKRDGNTPQIIFYDQGVGTGNILDRVSGGAFGEGLKANIYDAYRFLIANYEPGDELFFFGFSRGAFTARSIVGMIRNCGILSCKHVERYRDALALYQHPDHHPDAPTSIKFKQDYCVCGSDAIPVKFIGVWDTVGSLGIPLRGLRWLTRGKYLFHDTELSGTVERAYHALAIDEHRAPFEPTLWAYNPKPNQRVEQVWFCGAHSDIGGGYAECGLSDITLKWMIEKASDAGLIFDQEVMAEHEICSDPTGMLHNSKNGLYRLTAGIDRPIGLQASESGQSDIATSGSDPTQSLHDSVRVRWDTVEDYRPVPLKDYYARNNNTPQKS